MNATRLKQIEDIYHAVADHAPGDREAVVKAECRGDENLRREVESLLSYEEISDSFLDAPPDAIAAEMFSDMAESQPLIGKAIAHYTIKRLLGVGGMGEVYLADDSRLNRKVALKLLPPGLLERGDQLKRFKLEAQASSALNHPNILTIHEFGTENGSDYIVTEFVDGVTLRQRMQLGDMSVKDTVDFAGQVASALSAAHEAGIVHRDIKPENIMIRRDGIAKVLDFGLAKLTMPAGSGAETGLEAQTLFKTAPGVVMGTVGYMSPEQARGVKVDGRTDIWSLGVVIYEMAAGQLPFVGATKTDVLVAILNQPVPVLNTLTARAPAELTRIIEKALAKNADDRYQGVEELAADLKSLKNRLEYEDESGQPQTDTLRTIEEKEWLTEAATRMTPAADVETATQVRELRAHAENSGRAFTSKQRSLSIAAAVLIALVGVMAAFFWQSKNADSAAESKGPAAISPAAGTEETKPSRTLTYSLTVQSFTDGRYKTPFTLSGEMLFRNRDRVRLNLKSPQAGYLYMLNQGPKDSIGESSFNILFPSPTANDGTALLSPGEEIQIPRQSWFELDTKEGTELVWLVWSANALPELESAKRFANPNDKGRIKDADLINSIESMLLLHQSTKAAVTRDDDKKESLITGNADIVAHLIKLEHH